MRAVLVLAAAALLSAPFPRTAAAEGPPGTIEPTSAEPPPITTTTRYGYKILLADLAWFGAASLLSASGGEGGDGEDLVSMVAVGGYLGGGPAIHLAHGNAAGARKSLASRALLPLGGALVGVMLTSDGDDEDEVFPSWFYGMMLGSMVGFGTALVLDWTVFSKKTVTERARGPVGFGAHALRPSLKLAPGGATLSLAGGF